MKREALVRFARRFGPPARGGRGGRRGLVVVLLGIATLAAALVTFTRGDAEEPANPRAFCRNVARLGDLVEAAATGPQELAEVPAAQRLADEMVTRAELLAHEPPEEIREAARSLSSVTAELARELRDFYAGVTEDPAKANDPAYLASFDPLTPERRAAIEAAGEDVRPWVAEHC